MMSPETGYDRRRFLGTAAMSFASARLGTLGSSRPADSKKSAAGSQTS